MTRDPLKDPRPGDVVQVDERIVRSVTRGGHYVRFDSVVDGEAHKSNWLSISAWRINTKNATVLHVAENEHG